MKYELVMIFFLPKPPEKKKVNSPLKESYLPQKQSRACEYCSSIGNYFNKSLESSNFFYKFKVQNTSHVTSNSFSDAFDPLPFYSAVANDLN